MTTNSGAGRPTAIVVGSGIAGLVVALRAGRTHDVTLITKAELGESNTRYAQGGIAVALFADDSVESHVADTLVAGAGINRVAAVEVLCAEGPDRIRDLIRWGVEFDRVASEAGGSSALSAGRVEGDDLIDGLARGMEAAHAHARILHAGGDATGAEIESALVRAVRATASRILEYTFVADLVVEDVAGDVAGGVAGDVTDAAAAERRVTGVVAGERRVTGVEVIGPDGVASTLLADAVILASGGAGQLFAHTTNPEVTTGDGVAAAYRAGAQLSDLEFYQFHPTSLAVPGNFLISEAVRGEGAVLLNAAGERFMPAVHPDAELAPRDVVARAIAEQMQKQGGAPVLLDATRLGAEFLATRFPSITEACRRNGLDWSVQPIPVTPAAHYWMGGVTTDEWGRTSLAGLYAVGEVACTGVHGANRLASNSLLESVVFAWRCVDALRGEADPTLAPSPFAASVAPAPLTSATSDGESARFGREMPVQPPLSSETHSLDGAAPSRLELQQVMWNNVGVYRDAATLERALEALEAWAPSYATLHDRENANLLLLGTLIARSALAREESRGAHFRSDYPEPREVFRRHISVQQGSVERESAVAR
ncbi:L-aspartate oxidase [Subtercola lobariae]|uniref:L-aspartate oxidase n=1 Tax=Subtercola lobariae TaxID=1588641 RepID=A0A917B5T1_9MICO|nr:L-aspartate oxidase [Subtercola lobariae]GGF26166.1 L-aspartate oxidase [Subtercola lobariae]